MALSAEDLIRPGQNPEYRANPSNKHLLVHCQGDTADYHADFKSILDWHNNHQIGVIFDSIDPLLEEKTGISLKLDRARQLDKADYPLLYNKLLDTNYLDLTETDPAKFRIKDFSQFNYAKGVDSSVTKVDFVNQNLPDPQITSVASENGTHTHSIGSHTHTANLSVTVNSLNELGRMRIHGNYRTALDIKTGFISEIDDGNFILRGNKGSLVSDSVNNNNEQKVIVFTDQPRTGNANGTTSTPSNNNTGASSGAGQSITNTTNNSNYTNDQEVRPDSYQVYKYIYCDLQPTNVNYNLKKVYRDAEGAEKPKVYREEGGATKPKRYNDISVTGEESDTTLEREETTTADNADFMDISKPNKDYKISIANMKASLGNNFVLTDGTKPFEAPIGGVDAVNSNELVTKAQLDLIENNSEARLDSIETEQITQNDRIQQLEDNKVLLYPLGWTTTLPTTPGTQEGEFYHKGVEPVAEGYYRWDGTIWYEVQYINTANLTGYVQDNGTTPFVARQIGVPAINPNELMTLGQLMSSLPEYLQGVPSNFNYGAATNYPFTSLTGQIITRKIEDFNRKFTQSLSNISGTTTGQYQFIIDIAGSTLPDNTDVYIDFEWWFDYDSVNTSSELQIWLGGQRLDMTQTNTGSTAIGGNVKGWYKIKKSLNKAMALR